MLKFYQHPTCSTCKAARKWLDEHELDYQPINMIETPPTQEILTSLIEQSDLPLIRFFNTSGNRYRELGLKSKVPSMSIAEGAAVLASDGMLIKRPLLTDGKTTTLGFKANVYETTWNGN
ncbi:arsenate reductase family protein [Carnobacterium jeotgali]